MIRHDLMDLLRPVDIYEHRSEQPVLHATFPEEFRYLTEPPLPDAKVRLTIDDPVLENAFDGESIDFEAFIGIPSQRTKEMFEEESARLRYDVERLELELEHFTLLLEKERGRLRVRVRIFLQSVTKANAPEYVNVIVKYVLRELGHRNAVDVLMNPYIQEPRRREGAGLGVEMMFFMFDFEERLVLKDKVAGQSIYTFGTAEDEQVEMDDDFPVYPTPEFVDFINQDFHGPSLLNMSWDDDVMSLDWDICSVKIYKSLGRIEVTIFGEPRDNYPPFPNLTVQEALEVADAWFIETRGVQCRYTKYREQYELRQRTDDGEVRLKGGCINKEDPITYEDFEEDLNHPMVFQTTSGHCFKGTHTPQTLGQLGYRNPYNREILSSNCFEKVERDESAFMRMSLLGLN